MAWVLAVCGGRVARRRLVRRNGGRLALHATQISKTLVMLVWRLHLHLLHLL